MNNRGVAVGAWLVYLVIGLHLSPAAAAYGAIDGRQSDRALGPWRGRRRSG